MREPSKFFSPTFETMILPDFLSTYKNERTVKEYYLTICSLCDFLEKDFLDITKADADLYFGQLDDKISAGKLSEHTYNVRLSLCTKLSNHIAEHFEGLMTEMPFSHLARKLVSSVLDISKIPSMAEIDRILCAAKDYSSMYYLIISMVSRLGLTSSNIISLTRRNVLCEDGAFFLYFPAHGIVAEQVIYLPEDVQKLLCDYISKLPERKSCGVGADYLFYNTHGKPLTLRILDRHFSIILEKSGVSHRYTMKDVRSRAILEMTKAAIDNNVELSTVASYTGIRSLRMGSFAEACIHHSPCPAELVNFKLIV